jgi:predicted transposase YbfD/YdcC
LPKKTTEIIVDSGNHYILQVKGNQKKLHEQVQVNTFDDKSSIDTHTEITHKRGRLETRQTFVYKDLNCISDEWIGLKRLIRVERYLCKKGKQTHETTYCISSIASNKAAFFAKHIRNHWSIENRLHWVKDTIMNEDRSKTTGGMAAENISIIRNIVINLFRLNGHHSIKCAIELCANNFKELLSLINCKTKYYKKT